MTFSLRSSFFKESPILPYNIFTSSNVFSASPLFLSAELLLLLNNSSRTSKLSVCTELPLFQLFDKHYHRGVNLLLLGYKRNVRTSVRIGFLLATTF